MSLCPLSCSSREEANADEGRWHGSQRDDREYVIRHWEAEESDDEPKRLDDPDWHQDQPRPQPLKITDVQCVRMLGASPLALLRLTMTWMLTFDDVWRVQGMVRMARSRRCGYGHGSIRTRWTSKAGS